MKDIEPKAIERWVESIHDAAIHHKFTIRALSNSGCLESKSTIRIVLQTNGGRNDIKPAVLRGKARINGILRKLS